KQDVLFDKIIHKINKDGYDQYLNINPNEKTISINDIHDFSVSSCNYSENITQYVKDNLDLFNDFINQKIDGYHVCRGSGYYYYGVSDRLSIVGTSTSKYYPNDLIDLYYT